MLKLKRLSILLLALVQIISLIPVITVSAQAQSVSVIADESWGNATYDSTTLELKNIDGGYSFAMSLNATAKTATLSKFDLVNGVTSSKVVIPYQIIYNNVTYTVTAQGAYMLLNNSNTTNTTVTDLIISEGISTISATAFRSLQSTTVLTTVKLPSTLKSIAGNAFAGNAKLVNITPLPEGITTIGDGAFSGCSSLTSITLPSTVTSFGKDMFYSDAKLQSAIFNFPLTSINGYLFRGCTSLSTFNIPGTVTGTISPLAFSGSGITEVVIPAGVSGLGASAFDGCKSLVNVVIKGNITSWGTKAFYNDTALKKITFEGNIAPTIADTNSFYNVTGLTVYYPPNGTGYGEGSAFRSTFPAGTVFEMTKKVPTISGITLTGKNVVGNTLQGSYGQYIDPLGNAESGSTATWRRADDKAFTTNVVDIKTIPISQGAVSEYILTNADNGKYIQFSVIPRNAAQELNVGEEVSTVLNDQIRTPKTVPTVTLSSPYNNYRVHEKTDISLSASATCDNTTITKIEYYANNSLIAQATADPFDAVWNSALPGNYTIFARAYNGLGEYGDSASVSIKVYAISEPLDPVWAGKWSYDFNSFTSGTVYDSSSGLTLPGSNPPSISFNTGGTVQSAHGTLGKGVDDYQMQISSITGGTAVPYLYYPLNDLDEPIKNIVAEADVAFTTTNETRYALTYRTPRAAYNTFVFSNTGKIGYHTTPSQWTAFTDESGNPMTYEANKWYHISIKLDFESRTVSYYLNGINIRTMTAPDPDYFTSMTQLGFTGNHTNGTQFGSTYIDNLSLDQEQPSYVTSVLSSPVAGSYQLTGTPIQFTGYAKDARGKTINNVEIYANGALISDRQGSNYSFTKSDMAPGHYNIYARAISEDGMVGYSETVPITVSGAAFPSMYGDDMLLQRNKSINLTGTGVNGITITADLNGVTASTVVSNGKWRIVLPPQPAIKSTTIKFTTSEGVVTTFNNVAVGELILCSGQSNMQFGLDTFKLENEADKDYPDIRLFKQDMVQSSIVKSDVTNGRWTTATTLESISFSATGFLTGKYYYLSQNGEVPVGLIYAAVGGTSINLWVSPASFDYNPDLKKLKSSSTHYNAMVAPWTDFTIGHVIWYQGESNTLLNTPYEQALTALIDGYREAWKDSTIDFIVIQLPVYDYPTHFGGIRSAVGIRDGQFNVSQRLDKVASVVNIDLGNADGIHPLDKIPLAKRSALAIEHFTNATDSSLVWKSPSYGSFEQAGNTMTIHFNDVAGGLKTIDGAAPRGFKIAGDDGKFVDANVTLVGNTVVVDTTSVVGTPKVRYAWEDCPAWDFTSNKSTLNLVNSANLPMAPFRTDHDVYNFNTKNADGTYSDPVNFAPMIRTVTASDVINGVSKITVNARDYDGEIGKLDVYADSKLIGQAMLTGSEANYTFNWSNPTLGSHTLYAIATDLLGTTSVKSDASVGTTTVSPKNYVVNLVEGTSESIYSILPFENLSGQAISSFDGKNGVSVEAEKPESAVLILAAYQNGTLINMKVADCNTASFTANELANATEVKAFLFSNLGAITPLTEAKKIYKAL